MIRRPPRSTLSSSSAASDVYKRQFVFPFINFLRRTVEIAVALGMPAPAVTQTVDERGSLTGTGILASSHHRLIDRQHIIAIHSLARDSVADGSSGNMLDVHRFLHIHRHAVLIVVTNENHRQLPDGSHIQRLVELAFVRGPVSKVGEQDLL